MIFVLYRIVPLVWNIVLSFQAWSPLHPAVWVGWDNYDEMLFDDDVFWRGAVEHADIHVDSRAIGVMISARPSPFWLTAI